MRSDTDESREVGMEAVKPIPSVRMLLNEFIDYAGLFPPARLEMQQTVDNYARSLAGDESWMIGRLIIPVARLDEFEACAGQLLPVSQELDEPWRISAITAPAGDDALESDLARVAMFNDAHANPDAGLAIIDVLEMKGATTARIDTALDRMPDEVFPFFEMPVDRDPRGLIASLAGSDAGAKIRTGGVTADLHPAVGDVARFITACASASVPFKATAGLHQPLRHFAKAVETEQFGFFNIFIAAIFAYADLVTEDELPALLTEQNASAFEFHAEAIGWNGRHADIDTVDDARLMFAASFGSCSIDEPVEALRSLDLI